MEGVLDSLSKHAGLEMIDIQTTKWPAWTSTRAYNGPAFNKLVFLRLIGAPRLPQAFTQTLPRLAALAVAGVHGKMPPLGVRYTSKSESCY